MSEDLEEAKEDLALLQLMKKEHILRTAEALSCANMKLFDK